MALLVMGSFGVAFADSGVSRGISGEEDTEDSQISLMSNEEAVLNYETHEPIKINNNTDLNDTAQDEGWPGGGNESDPYIIEGYDIDGYDTDGDPTGYAVYIGNTTDHFVVRDCKLHDAEDSNQKNAGLHLFNVTNGKIENNEITSNEEYGIYMKKSLNNSINNNTVSSGAYYHEGIHLDNSDDNILNNNTVDSNYRGIYLDSSESNILKNNTASDNSYEGIYLSNSDHINMKNNTISSNDDEGIYLSNSDYTNMENNTISSNDDYGLYISYSQGITLKNNVMMYDGILVRGSFTDWTTLEIDLSNTVNGDPVRLWKNRTSGTVPTDTGQVILANCTGVSVEDQDISQSSVGILVGLSDNITIYNNTLSDNDDGLYLDDSTDISSMNNSATGNRKGFYLDNTGSSTFENNTLESNTDDGMYIYYSDGNMFRNNNLSSNYDGIELYRSDGNTLVNNSFYSNDKYGIYTSYSDSNVLKNNTVASSDGYGIYLSSSESISMENTTMIKDGVMIKGTSISHWNTHDIDLSNTVNGKPIRYWEDKTSGDMPADTGQVILANSTGVTVEDKKYDNSSVGVLVGHSNENYFMNNTLRSNDEGLYTYYSDDNMIRNNTVVSNQNGIKLDHSYFNTLTNNSIYSNTGYGIYLYYSDSNTIENNEISSDNGRGVYIYRSDLNTLTYNNISSNDGYGVYLYSSAGNSIENNSVYMNADDGIYLSSSDDNSIENNTIDSNDGDGIYFSSSRTNTLKNNTISLNYNGIYMYSSNSNHVSDNRMSSNDRRGMYIRYSGSNTLKNNTLTNNTYEGIYLYSSNNNLMIENTVSSNPEEGIYLYSSDDNTLQNNTVSSNSEEGIYLSTSDNNDIENNSISLNSYDGIYIRDSSLNILNNNTLSENADYGIYLNSNTDNTTIYHNNIIDNSGQGLDDGEDNRWYSDTLQEGNYWSDYNGTDSDGDGIGDTPYTDIEGSSGNNDTYPLIYAVDDDVPPSLDADNSPSTGAAGGEYTFEIEASDDLGVKSVNASWSHDSLSGNKALSEEDEGTWTGTITLDMSSDNLTYRIQVNDSAGNYVRSDEKEISVIIDTDGPTINDTTSGTPTTGEAFNVTADVSDDTYVDTVWLNYTLTGVEGYSKTFNRSMNPDHWYELSIWNNATDLDYTIAANDTVDNWNSSSSSYSVTDNEDPSMTDDSPNFGYTSEDFSFKVTATDNIGVGSVNVSWSHGSLSGNVPLSDADDDGIWEGTITLDNSASDLTYRIQVNDTSGNHVLSSARSVTVLDSDKPLRIDNNGELASAATSGSGTETDPYMIEGLDIDGYGRGYGIYIGNTTEHFIVRDNELYNASGNSNQYFKNSGLYLYNVTNGSAEDNTIYNNYENGILLQSSGDNTVQNNDVSENRYGIFVLDSSSDNLLKGNNVNFNSDSGIYVKGSKRNTIKDNNVSDNDYYGIQIYFSNNNTIENNTAYRVSRYALYIDRSANNTLRGNNASGNNLGILLRYSDNNLVINNSAYENSYGIGFTNSQNNIIQGNNFSLNDYGIYVYSSGENTILENTISSNSNYGLYFRSGTSNNLIYHNDILNNSIQAADDGTDNQWYNATLEEGNYWSDYNGTDMDGDGVGETNYTKIDGSAGSNDTYPLTIPNNDHQEPSLDEDNSPENGTTGDEYTFNITATDDFEVGSVNVSWSHGSRSGDLALSYAGNDTWNGTIILDHSLDVLTYRVQVNDTSGNYVRGAEQTVSISDNDDPNFTDNSAGTGTTEDSYTFDIDPEDNVAVDSVNVSWTHGALSGNLALTDDGDGTWGGTVTLDDSLSDMTYRVQVNDTSGNYIIGSEQPVTVSDNDDPSFVDNSPGTGTTGDTYTFEIDPEDNIGVDSVNVSWSHGGLSGNLALTDDGDGTWTGTITLDDSLSDMTYRVQVNDTSSNYLRGAEQTVSISDNDDPSFMDNSPGTGTTGDTYTFDIDPEDNIGVDSVNASWSHGSVSGNLALSDDGDGTWSGLITLDDSLSDLTYRVQVNDTSGNYVRGSEQQVSISDNDNPAITDTTSGTPTTGEVFNVTADVSDNIDEDTVWLEYTLTSIEGYTQTCNVSMNPNYWLEVNVWSNATDLDYTIAANDTSDNWNSVSNSSAVEDNDDPTAAAGGDKTVDEDTVVTFDASSSSDNVGIVNHTWIIDGTEYYREVVEHTFAEPGIYTVELNVADEAGNYDTDTVEVTVNDVTDPTADTGEDKTVDEDKAVTFDASGSSDNVGIVNYTWIIEGTEYYGEVVEYTFTDPGIYTVEMNVTDDAGNYDTDTVEVTVNDVTDPTADAGEGKVIDEDTMVTFNGSGSEDNVGIVVYTWTIEGTEYDGEVIEHTFAEPGHYTVELNVTDEAGNYDIDTITVTVEDITDPTADAGEDKTVDEDKVVTFDGSGSSDNVDIVNYTWMIEGTEFYGEVVDHTFTDPGDYTVELNVADDAGNYDTDTITVTVEDVTDPTAAAGGDKTVDEDTVVIFDASGSADNVGIMNYTWTIEGAEYYGETVEHAFAEPGIYTVELNVADEVGNYDTDTVEVTVNDVTGPTADTGEDKTVDEDKAVTFDASGSSDNVGIVNYTWIIEGTEYYGEVVEYTFTDPG
ncbi:MAG: right-handed parallel beta-helix repeat-containing protein, partial [Candidatus Thermoplasmatota archaeon]|nr:right-handed parallel beta-helix repeat-containing protein [Candidatus Thermoplasmatota archaeon]